MEVFVSHPTASDQFSQAIWWYTLFFILIFIYIVWYIDINWYYVSPSYPYLQESPMMVVHTSNLGRWKKLSFSSRALRSSRTLVLQLENPKPYHFFWPHHMPEIYRKPWVLKIFKATLPHSHFKTLPAAASSIFQPSWDNPSTGRNLQRWAHPKLDHGHRGIP